MPTPCSGCALPMGFYEGDREVEPPRWVRVFCPACHRRNPPSISGPTPTMTTDRRESLRAPAAKPKAADGMCASCAFVGESRRATARFQCMRCMARSVLCGPCSMDGTCPSCLEKQPRTVDAFVEGVKAGLEDAPMTEAEMAREAKALNDHFGDDFKARIFGHGPGRE